MNLNPRIGIGGEQGKPVIQQLRNAAVEAPQDAGFVAGSAGKALGDIGIQTEGHLHDTAINEDKAYQDAEEVQNAAETGGETLATAVKEEPVGFAAEIVAPGAPGRVKAGATKGASAAKAAPSKAAEAPGRVKSGVQQGASKASDLPSEIEATINRARFEARQRGESAKSRVKNAPEELRIRKDVAKYNAEQRLRQTRQDASLRFERAKRDVSDLPAEAKLKSKQKAGEIENRVNRVKQEADLRFKRFQRDVSDLPADLALTRARLEGEIANKLKFGRGDGGNTGSTSGVQIDIEGDGLDFDFNDGKTRTDGDTKSDGNTGSKGDGGGSDVDVDVRNRNDGGGQDTIVKQRKKTGDSGKGGETGPKTRTRPGESDVPTRPGESDVPGRTPDADTRTPDGRFRDAVGPILGPVETDLPGADRGGRTDMGPDIDDYLRPDDTVGRDYDDDLRNPPIERNPPNTDTPPDQRTPTDIDLRTPTDLRLDQPPEQDYKMDTPGRTPRKPRTPDLDLEFDGRVNEDDDRRRRDGTFAWTNPVASAETILSGGIEAEADVGNVEADMDLNLEGL
ncbi:hypothetical protein M0R89_10505 [Halorussus limi]|uniref:Uncharacterized protein n=1 Tax=Halorussus limi TaxID=2938695 RepID=A0A8U0HQ41_9EURY|nr:hypothetical protein [Halorussus limi]UPV72979.1 hypothetical protein M0R89_10505 [Halorussus limi]